MCIRDRNGDLVLSPQNLWLGNININNIGIGLVSPSYKTFKFTNIKSSFFNPQIRTQKMLEEYKNASTPVSYTHLDVYKRQYSDTFGPSVC